MISAAVQKTTRRELSDLQGKGWYDESRKIIQLERWHKWPPSGEQGHIGLISCMCGPDLIFEDETGFEFWQHWEWRQ